MTRTTAREIAVQLGFWVARRSGAPEAALDEFFDPEYYATLAKEDENFSEYPDEKQMAYIRRVVTGAAEHSAELDALIEKYSRGWKLSRISAIAATILRTAMFEVLYMDDVPESVAINEAVELAKGYEEPETVAFINGILGSVSRAAPDAEEDQ